VGVCHVIADGDSVRAREMLRDILTLDHGDMPGDECGVLRRISPCTRAWGSALLDCCHINLGLEPPGEADNQRARDHQRGLTATHDWTNYQGWEGDSDGEIAFMLRILSSVNNARRAERAGNAAVAVQQYREALTAAHYEDKHASKAADGATYALVMVARVSFPGPEGAVERLVGRLDAARVRVPTACAWCHQSAGPVGQDIGCNRAYCDVSCQKKDWVRGGHRFTCARR
jgi:hypothetical protein